MSRWFGETSMAHLACGYFSWFRVEACFYSCSIALNPNMFNFSAYASHFRVFSCGKTPTLNKYCSQARGRSCSEKLIPANSHESFEFVNGPCL